MQMLRFRKGMHTAAGSWASGFAEWLCQKMRSSWASVPIMSQVLSAQAVSSRQLVGNSNCISTTEAYINAIISAIFSVSCCCAEDAGSYPSCLSPEDKQPCKRMKTRNESTNDNAAEGLTASEQHPIFCMAKEVHRFHAAFISFHADFRAGCCCSILCRAASNQCTLACTVCIGV